jgi:sirohydrochlorin cobaltochelatase
MLLLVLDRADEVSDDYRRMAALAGAWAGVQAQLCALAGGSAAGEVLPLTTALQAAAARAESIVVQRLGLVADPEIESEIVAMLRWAHGRWPERQVIAAKPLLGRPYMVSRLAGRTEEAAGRTGEQGNRGAGEQATMPIAHGPEATAVLLVAAGSGEAEANADVARLARLLWEGHDWATVEIAFARQSAPDVAAGLERCRRLGATRVIVLPLAALPGTTSEQIEAQVARARGSVPGLEVVAGKPPGTAEGLGAIAADRYREALGLGVPVGAHGHDHDHGIALDFGPLSGMGTILPPRYANGSAVSSAPMGAAPLKYDEGGEIAWDEIWTDFCDLALAGGPPHRGDLLLPPDPQEVRERPDEQARVLDELARGLRLITGWPVVREAVPGWIGLACPDAEAAIWLMRAIIVENVAVRRESTTLFLPAGPDFRLTHEIKNVITVVAKTHHYWTEHVQESAASFQQPAVSGQRSAETEQAASRQPEAASGKLPRYEYECKECQTRFDVARSPEEASQPYACPFCGGAARRVFSAPKLLFKADPRDSRPVWHSHGGFGHSHAPGKGFHGRGRGGT